jgi:hypothetical protein
VTVPPVPISGIVEGFYGRPWTWDERIAVASHCAGWGMTDYVHAPKDDAKHRAEWRVPYDDGELAGFARFAENGVLRLGFGISPGLSIDSEAGSDRGALAAKVDQVVDAGARIVALCVDDIPFGGAEQGEAHGRLAAWLAEHVAGRAAVVLVPTEYVGIHPTPYLRALDATLPQEVRVGWTGDAVVNEAITIRQAERRAEALGGRLPLVWDNVPVNDGLMGERLHLGPLWGRDEGLLDGRVSGWLANPMVQPTASLLPLASIAAWLRGEDPLDAWAAEADRRGWRVFAEACDGAVPHALTALAADAFAAGKLREDDLEPLRAWFSDAAEVTAPGLDDECAGWLTQVRAEAAVALAAVELIGDVVGDGELRGTDLDLVTRTFTLGFRWRALQRSELSVMGPRLGFQPAFGQAADGRWAVRRSSVIEGASAVDGLCRLAFDAVAWSADRG